MLVADDDPWFRVLDLPIAGLMMPEMPGFPVAGNARHEFPALKVVAVPGVGMFLPAARLSGVIPERFKEFVRFLFS